MDDAVTEVLLGTAAAAALALVVVLFYPLEPPATHTDEPDTHVLISGEPTPVPALYKSFHTETVKVACVRRRVEYSGKFEVLKRSLLHKAPSAYTTVRLENNQCMIGRRYDFTSDFRYVYEAIQAHQYTDHVENIDTEPAPS